MKLYHGTSAFVAKRAIVEGLKPRSLSGRQTTWSKAPSNRKCVYMTDAYAMYFALNAIPEKLDPRTPGPQCAIIEIDTDLLPAISTLVPDEDMLEQVGRNNDGIPGSMQERSFFYRNSLDQHMGTDNWKVSMVAMGTCAHFGTIPPAAITRVAWIRASDAPVLSMHALDPTITVMNYQTTGHRYKAMLQTIMGASDEDLALIEAGHMDLPIDYDLIDHYRTECADAVTIQTMEVGQ